MLRVIGRGLAAVVGGSGIAVVAIGLPERNPLGFLEKDPPVPLSAAYTKKMSLAFEGTVIGRFILRTVPRDLLYKTTISFSAPTVRPKDCLESGLGPTTDLYRVKEVKPDSVFLVEYDSSIIFPPGDLAMHGMSQDDWINASVAAADRDPKDTADAAVADAIALVEYSTKSKGEWVEGTTGQRFPMTMVVAKLKSGGTLLYSPVIVHDGTPFAQWLESQGPVKYLVVGSAAHTLHLPEVIKKYPDAKVIGPPGAQDKLAEVGALPRGKFDYRVHTVADAGAANAELKPEGIELYKLEGDAATQAICVVANKTAMDVDILYGHLPQCKCTQCHDSQYMDRPDLACVRCFKRAIMSPPNTANDFLPHYRLEMMDPAAGLTAMFGPYAPAADGSSATKMAASLRTFLAADFDTAVSGHSTGVFDRDDYRAAVDGAWQWLDGKSLV